MFIVLISTIQFGFYAFFQIIRSHTYHFYRPGKIYLIPLHVFTSTHVNVHVHNFDIHAMIFVCIIMITVFI